MNDHQCSRDESDLVSTAEQVENQTRYTVHRLRCRTCGGDWAQVVDRSGSVLTLYRGQRYNAVWVKSR